MKFLKLKGKNYKLPIFFPDATRGYVKYVSSKDLQDAKVQGVVVNTYHLLQENLIPKIEKIGIHKYMNFYKPIISDSGGFQVMSLIHQNPKPSKLLRNRYNFDSAQKSKYTNKISDIGKIKENEIVFNLDNKKIRLTPENCIKTQIKIGSDIVMCLDDCTKPESNLKEQEKSVERTIRWARKCKKEFERLTKNKRENKPILFAIIQGGNHKKLRKYCAKELVKIGFDGYSFGGFPMRNEKLMKNILQYVSDLIPRDKIKYAMGVGKPGDIIECFKLGYNMFDCVIPTRDARHKRLFIFIKNPNKKNLNNSFKEINIRKKYLKEKKISKYCDCQTCKKYTRKQLLILFKEDKEAAFKLASIHNLRFYSKLMEILNS